MIQGHLKKDQKFLKPQYLGLLTRILKASILLKLKN